MVSSNYSNDFSLIFRMANLLFTRGIFRQISFKNQYNSILCNNHYIKYKLKYSGAATQLKFYSTAEKGSNSGNDDDTSKLTLFQKFKKMYREYWYVVVPVYLVISPLWFGGCYYLIKSGVDIGALLDAVHLSDKFSLKESNMGNLAVTYVLYKLTAPPRYTIIVGSTTVSINYLKKWGYIKPAPSTDRLKEMIQEKKETFIDSVRDKQTVYKEKGENLMDSVREKKDQIKDQLTKNEAKK